MGCRGKQEQNAHHGPLAAADHGFPAVCVALPSKSVHHFPLWFSERHLQPWISNFPSKTCMRCSLTCQFLTLHQQKKMPKKNNSEDNFWWFICGFVFISGLVGMMVLLVGFYVNFEADSQEEGGSDDDNVDSGENGVPVGSPPTPSSPRTKASTTPRFGPGPGSATSSARITNAPTTLPTTSMTTTNPPPPLLCSVDHTATVENVYPVDSLCDILIYMHVRVDKSNRVASLNNDSYMAFTTVCAGYTSTSCGLSFDSRYADKKSFENQTTQQNLRGLSPSMKHLAIMNIYGSASRLAFLASTLPDALKAETF
ncbi:uncharacterized protein LOC144098093 [Amblyomma americanum]